MTPVRSLRFCRGLASAAFEEHHVHGWPGARVEGTVEVANWRMPATVKHTEVTL